MSLRLSLQCPEVNNLYEIIRNLKAKGKTVIYISHRLEELFEDHGPGDPL